MSETKASLNQDILEFTRWKENTRCYSFNTINLSVSTFVNDCRNGVYVLDPEHQRNVVHNDKWQSSIVYSLLTGMPLGSPEFDTCKYLSGPKIGLEYKRSLDGKQRLSSILRMANNEYKMECLDIPAIHRKKFENWPTIWQNHFNSRQFAIATTDKKLTDEEVTAYFDKKQNTKVTSTGETFNAIIGNRTKLCKKLTNDLPFPERKVNKDNRFKLLELTVRMSYAIYSIDNNQNLSKIDPNKKTLVKFLKNDQLNDEQTFNYYHNIIKNVVECINSFTQPCKDIWSKTNVIPLLYLFHIKKHSINSVKQFISNNIDGNPNFFDNVGGNHNASTQRCIFILEKYNNRMITL